MTLIRRSRNQPWKFTFTLKHHFLSISTFQCLFVIWWPPLGYSGIFTSRENRVLRSEVIIRKRDFPLRQETCSSNYLGRWKYCFCHEIHSCNICCGKSFILERQVEKKLFDRIQVLKKRANYIVFYLKGIY